MGEEVWLGGGVCGGVFVEDFLDFCFGGNAGGILEPDDEDIMELGEWRGDISLKQHNTKIMK